MSTEMQPRDWSSRSDSWLQRVRLCIGPASDLRLADLALALTAAALPWSTTATAVFVVIWLVMVVSVMDWDEFMRGLALPASAWPLMMFCLADLGVLWSMGPLGDRLHGINPVSKLLLIPFLLHHFKHSPRAIWVLTAFAGSCTMLMMLSWIVLIDPALKLTATASAGVPVKNYIDQSQEFALCAFVLALPALTAFRERRFAVMAGLLALILAFLANMLFVVSARTALLYMPVLLVAFALRFLDRRAMIALFVVAVVGVGAVWTTSPYLRQRITDIGIEYQDYQADISASTAQRLTYWQKSLKFIASAPLFGHGTGAIRQMFEGDAVGHTGLQAEIINNPHNQTLNVAVQWGLAGVVILFAMWFSHLRLFRGGGLLAWTGLAVVLQNVVSSLLNSHLFDFTEGWIYVLGVGVAGGALLAGEEPPAPAPLTDD